MKAISALRTVDDAADKLTARPFADLLSPSVPAQGAKGTGAPEGPH